MLGFSRGVVETHFIIARTIDKYLGLLDNNRTTS